MTLMWSLLKQQILTWRISVGLSCVILFALSATAVGQEPLPLPYGRRHRHHRRPMRAKRRGRFMDFRACWSRLSTARSFPVKTRIEQFNPASTLKLATALVALQTLGPSHRFATGVWTDGTIDKSTGVLTGNLYISGRDPSFHYEHAVLLAKELNGLGIKEVSGNLIVAPGFTMNFSPSAARSGNQLYDTLDSTLRYAEAVRAWNYERTLLNDRESLEKVPSVAVMGEVSVGPVANFGEAVVNAAIQQAG